MPLFLFTTKMNKCKPFVKWVGGKRSLMPQLLKHIPTNFNTYYEPFIGGGALFFEIAPNKAIIGDLNKELVNAYNCLKDPVKMAKICQELNLCEEQHSKDFFYEIRSWDRNKELFNTIPDYKRATRFIYLNKACFNGKYQVNSKDEFNSSFNYKDKVNTYDKQNLENITTYLSNNDITILGGDFTDIVSNANKGDFVYFDPPYDTDTKVFNKYTSKKFDKEEQKRLASVYKELANKGCYVMLSNHNTKLVNELYKDFNIYVVKAKRCINPLSEQKQVDEVIITNY